MNIFFKKLKKKKMAFKGKPLQAKLAVTNSENTSTLSE